jgi:glycosyltransferase involved in cell wall biosynthesis
VAVSQPDGQVQEARVTVLLPVRDYHPPFLERAIACIFGQTSPHWRLLVITQPGREQELTTVLGEAALDPRVRVIARERPRLAGALNTGMRRADTEFVGILLGDDLWAPEAVAVLADAMERFPDVDFFHSSRIIIDEHDRPISSIRLARDGWSLDDFVDQSQAKHLLCWRRERGLAIGGIDESLASVGPDDWDFPWSMAEAGARFKAIPEILYFHRDHRECYRLTTHQTLQTHEQAMRRLLEKHGVDPARAESVVAAARKTYLQQCLYRSRWDLYVKRLIRWDVKRGRRLTYR